MAATATAAQGRNGQSEDTGASALLDTLRLLNTKDEEDARDQLSRAGLISEAFKEMIEADPSDKALRAEAKRWVEFYNKRFK